MQLLDDAIAILLFIMVLAGVPVIHPISHRVIEQDRDLAGSSRHRFGRADASCEAPVEGAERGVASSDGHGCQPNCNGEPAAGLARMRRQYLAAADFASGRERQPRREVFRGTPSAQVRTAFADKA